MPRRAYDIEQITGEKLDRIIYSITIDYITVWTRPEINNVIGQDSVVIRVAISCHLKGAVQPVVGVGRR